MTQPVWHSGPPPSEGWWPASVCLDPSVLRWRSGGSWSINVSQFADAKTAAHYAMLLAAGSDQHRIQWTDRPASWPARSKT